MIMMSVGLALVFIPVASTALHAVGGHDAGVASALITTSQQVGGSLGRRTGHPAELVVEAEEVLEGDRRERDVLLLDLHTLLRLDRLVEPVAPAPSRHRPARELVDDHHLAVADDVLPI